VHLKLSQQDHQAVIDVEDTTPSVASEDLPRLFERLYRVEGSRNRATGGAGLGLPLCLSIVEAHHGQMTAKPSTMGGLHLHVVFPLLAQKGTRS
jgi:two-component system sensor histidine kinase BaeS